MQVTSGFRPRRGGIGRRGEARAGAKSRPQSKSKGRLVNLFTGAPVDDPSCLLLSRIRGPECKPEPPTIALFTTHYGASYTCALPRNSWSLPSSLRLRLLQSPCGLLLNDAMSLPPVAPSPLSMTNSSNGLPLES